MQTPITIAAPCGWMWGAGEAQVGTAVLHNWQAIPGAGVIQLQLQLQPVAAPLQAAVALPVVLPPAAPLPVPEPPAPAPVPAPALAPAPQPGVSTSASVPAVPRRPEKRGRKPLVLTPAERAAKLAREREQNRLMQGVRRQRQKEHMLEVQQRHEEAVVELQRARAARSGLEHINGLLESLLTLRDESVDVLQRCEAAGGPQGSSRVGGQQQQQEEQQQLLLPAAPNSPAMRVKEMLSAGCELVAELEPAAAAGVAQPTGEARGAGNAGAVAAQDSLGSLLLPWALEGGSLSGFSLGLPSLGEPEAGAGVAGAAAGMSKQQSQEGLAPGDPSCWPSPDGGPEQPSTPTSVPATASGRRTCSSGLGGPGSFRARWTVHHGFQQGGDDDLQGWLDAAEADPEVLERIKACDPLQFIRGWRSFAGRVREVLLEYDVTDNPATLLRLKPLMESWAATMMLMLRHKPACVQQLFASSAEHGLSEAEAQDKWDGIAAAMEFTPSQRHRYLARYEAYVARAREVEDKRRRATALIRQASSEELTKEGEGLCGIMSRYLLVAEAMAELSAAPTEEFAALLDFLADVGQVCTPVQKARVLAMSYPHFPDVLQIVEAVKRLGQ